MFLKLSVFQVEDIDKFDVRITGQNQKKCLVIVPSAGFDTTISAFLSKIFSAVSLDLEKDIALYAWHENDTTSITQLMNIYPFSTCLFFGVSPALLGLKMHIEPWKILPMQQFSLLYCESLTKIATDQALKKHLWDNLKLLWK